MTQAGKRIKMKKYRIFVVPGPFDGAPENRKTPRTLGALGVSVVDDTGLEPVTSRTSTQNYDFL